MARIFISHSSKNNAEAIAVRDWLVAQGWDDLFLDLDPHQGLQAGERWQDALKNAAGRCEAVLFLITPEWAVSKWCLAEFLLAKSMNKRLFGVLVAKTDIETLPFEMTAEWQITDLVAEPRSITIDVKLPSGGKRQTVTFSEDGLMRLKLGLEQSGLDARYFAWPPDDDPMRTPYRGLKPLEAEDAGIFFGREGAIVEALDALRGLREAAPPRLFVILGASGSGKSSFLRAGLLPRLTRDDRHFVPLPILRPERAALTGANGLIESISGACNAHGLKKTRAEIRKAVESGAEDLKLLLRELAKAATPGLSSEALPPKPPALVLPIDQGEELHLAEGAEEATAFLDLLRGLVEGDDPPLIALFTIRSDAYERLQNSSALEGLTQQTFSLAALPRGAYRQVITDPAHRLSGTDRALVIEELLVDGILADIEKGGSKDALPLLAFTMERLYLEYGDDGDLKLSEYEALGRIRGSIEAAVEGALKAADGDPKVPADRQARLVLLRRGLIPWLAGIDLDTGAPRRRVARLSEIPEESLPLITHLIEQRLLATDVSAETGETTIEPAHEALLRQWGLLEGWLEEDFEALTALEGVKRAARDWQANDRDAQWLTHAGGRLDDAERVTAREEFVASVEPGERAYLAAARAAENARAARERRTRQWIVAASLLAAFSFALFGTFAGWQWFQAEASRMQAELQRNMALKAESLFLADLAAIHTESGDQVTGMLLSLSALRDETAENETQRTRPYAAQAESRLYGSWSERREVSMLGGHEKTVYAASFSADGTRVVTASGDNTARIWDAKTGAEIAVLRGHEKGVSSASFSPDGARIVTASDDKTARIWDAQTGAEIAVLRRHKKLVNAASFSPDGARIVTTSWDNTARLWDAKTGAEIAVLRGHGGSVNAASFSPDGARIVTASSDNTARIWDAQTGSEIAVLRRHENLVSAASFSPDGTRIVTTSGDNTARIWDAQTGVEIVVLREHQYMVRSASFSADGARIVTASWDNTARIWDAQTGAEIAVLRGHEKGVSSASFSPDGALIVTTSWDNTARLWDAKTGVEIVVMRGHGGSVNAASFSPDGARIVTASNDETARIWDAKTGAEIAVLRGHEKGVSSASFSPDGARIVTASWDKTARIWDTKTGAEIAVLRGHEGVVNAASYSLDGARVVTASLDNTARVWDAKTGAEITVLRGHEDWVMAASFSPDSALVVTVSRDNTARIWDANSGSEIAVLRGHEKMVSAASFSPDGARIVTASLDGTAWIWDAKTGAEITVLRGHENSGLVASFSPDGARIVTESGDNAARIWDAKTGAGIAVLRGHEGALHAASFSPDGARIVTASRDNTARIWDAKTGAEIAVLRGHEDAVDAASFSPDGARIVTASDDKTARIWDANSGEEIAVLRGHENSVLAASFSPDGAHIVTASGDYTARIWPVFSITQDLIDHAKSVVSRCLTAKQRETFHLSTEPPAWCIDRAIWPNDTDEWRAWLADKRAGGDPQMPK